MKITTTTPDGDSLAAAETPLLERLSPIPTFDHDGDISPQSFSEKPLLPFNSPEATSFPPAPLTRAISTPYPDLRHDQQAHVPQNIAHRGFSARYPENSLAAFKGAVLEAGANAIETDIHLSKDEVVVLCHDAALERVFGVPGKVSDYTWAELKEMKTKREPRQRMCSLGELLAWLANEKDHEEGETKSQNSPTRTRREDIWLLLDIKLDNDPNTVMRCLAETIRAAPISHKHPWDERIVLGIWAVKFMPYCTRHLPSHPVAVISAFLLYARHFFAYPNVNFNLLQPALMGIFGSLFLGRARRLNRQVFAWTVNKESRMRWCIDRGLDGVITDDPVKFGEVCREWAEGLGAHGAFSEGSHNDRRSSKAHARLTPKDWLEAIVINLFTLLVGVVLYCFSGMTPPTPHKLKAKWASQQ